MVIQEFTSIMQNEFEDEAFLVPSIKKFMVTHLTLDNLKVVLERHRKAYVTIKESIT